MADEKIDTLDNSPKLPNTWKVITLSCVIFIVIFCLFTLVNFVNVLMLFISIQNFFSDPNLVPVGEFGDIVMALGLGAIIFFGVLLFNLPLNIYIALHGSKRILHKWYNNIPILQAGKLLFPTFILFCVVFFVNNILWIVTLYTDYHLFLLPSFLSTQYIAFYLAVISFYISKITIKKLTKGMSHE